MDHSTIVSSTPRPSAIPRLSKLPVPRPSSSLTNHTASSTRSPLPLASLPEQRLKQSIGRQSLLGTVRGRPSLLPPPTPSVANATVRRPPTSQTLKRQPLGPPLRPQSKQEPRQKAQPDHIEVDGVLYVKAERRLSEQENDFQDQSNEDDTVVTPDESFFDVGSPTPSLSDRTVESLAHIPTGTGSVRRRSSFFNPYSPMTPSRPPSTMDNHSISKLNYGSVRRIAPPRQSGLYNKPVPASQTSTPARPALARRSISSALPKTSIIPARPAMPSRISTTAARSLARPASAAVAHRNPPPTQTSERALAAKTTRPSSSLSQVNRTTAPARPASRLRIEAKPLGASTRQAPPKQIEKSTLKKPTTTSAALRSQIAQARLAQRNTLTKPLASSCNSADDAMDFENCHDPFNQNVADDQASLQKRMDAARRDGRLNIASLGLKDIPDQVMHMYDAEAMENSSVTWSETVDISRFVAADNELEAISDEVFPDLSMEELAENEDPRGNLFGGVELIDLHGNMLQSLPLGLRRLELLTTLNLSRNKFENSIFDTLTQIPTLRTLNLASNDLSRDLPESIGLLTQLETVHLHGNKLVLLPTTMRFLIHLRHLDVSSNRLSDLAIDSLVELPSLFELHASKNALTGSLFPSTATYLPNLRVLDVSNNSIASLTFSTTLCLPSLTHLDVSRNRLYAMPDISEWTSLLTLLAEDNMLTQLPQGFTSLNGLKSADFKGNDMKSVDVEVGKMKGLERLVLENNPLRERRWASAGWEVVRREMVRRLEEGERLGKVDGVVEEEVVPEVVEELVGEVVYDEDDEMF